jgi:hypothetical protein
MMTDLKLEIEGFKHDARQVREWLKDDYGIEEITCGPGLIILHNADALTANQKTTIESMLGDKASDDPVNWKEEEQKPLKTALAKLDGSPTVKDVATAVQELAKVLRYG